MISDTPPQIGRWVKVPGEPVYALVYHTADGEQFPQEAIWYCRPHSPDQHSGEWELFQPLPDTHMVPHVIAGPVWALMKFASYPNPWHVPLMIAPDAP